MPPYSTAFHICSQPASPHPFRFITAPTQYIYFSSPLNRRGKRVSLLSSYSPTPPTPTSLLLCRNPQLNLLCNACCAICSKLSSSKAHICSDFPSHAQKRQAGLPELLSESRQITSRKGSSTQKIISDSICKIDESL